MKAAGKKREFWRIREFLAEKHGLSMAEVGRRTGIHKNVVRETALGTRNNREVLKYLRKLGCPEMWLDLPRDMKEQR